ncbi:MAG TPA: hypothetical protein VF121_01555 [Thermoanaerobaculia bacterium]|nr:hypothetical protein [Thermoanaerobaculia bacterium]
MRRAAARVEAIRTAVAAEVGYAPPQRVEVLVSDPIAAPNGAAIPLLGRPRLVLWTSPPPPDSVIGHYRDWSEALLVHEEAHLAHLLRPSRNPLRRSLAWLLPVGPIALAAPRWAVEGYATLVEGRLTGAGRPHGDLRAAVLRRWALAGRLPSYGQLSGDDRWLGLSMAYLAGSAYLEWLDARAGPGSLPKLWARLSARRSRSFEEAFRGVFGDDPADLYGRFTAELTHRAVEAERRLAAAAPEGREGVPWQDLEEATGAPAVSPDGGALALVRRRRDEPGELVVWATAPDAEAEKKWQEEVERLLRRDPEDVAPVRSGPLPRKERHLLALEPEATMPRYLADGSVLFVRFAPDREGYLHPDLFRWEPGAGGGVRLTRGADLRDPDPAPDGRWAAATRIRHGLSQVVRVDLASGAVEPITAPALSALDHPRVAPDGGRVAFARHAEGRWELVVRDLAGGGETRLEAPPGGTVATPAWARDGRTLFAAVGQAGFIDLWAFPVTPAGPPVRLTRTAGAALAPEPTPDGSGLFYLSLAPDGLDLYRLELPAPLAARPPMPVDTAGLVPAVPPPPPAEVPPFAEVEPGPSRPYGGGPAETLLLSTGATASAGSAWDAGVRVGDPVGRWNVLALVGGSGDGGPKGGGVAAAFRGWPVEVSAHGFQVEEQPSRQDDAVAAAALLDAERRGLELAVGWRPQGLASALGLSVAGYTGEVEDLDQEILSLAASWQVRRRVRGWTLSPWLAARGDSGDTGGDSWERWRGTAGLRLADGDGGALDVAWTRGRVSGAPHALDLFQVGGSGSSLLPETLLAARIEAPALPVGALLGDEIEWQRAHLSLDALPAPLFFERFRVGRDGDWLRLAGLEWRLRLPPLPIARLPAVDLRAGAARVLDGPLRGDERWWIALVARP